MQVDRCPYRTREQEVLSARSVCSVRRREQKGPGTRNEYVAGGLGLVRLMIYCACKLWWPKHFARVFTLPLFLPLSLLFLH